MMCNGLLSAALAASIFCALPSIAHAADVIVVETTFQDGLDGWKSNVPDEINWEPSGGKPAGFLKSTDKTSGPTTAIAPRKFRGNYRDLGITKIVFNHRVIEQTNDTAYSPYEIRLSGPRGSARWTAEPPTGVGPWVKKTARLRQADWEVTSGTWNGLLKKVTKLEIEVELATNATIPGDTDIEGIDNVQLLAAGAD
jgi:hypothetical protein